MSLAIKVYIRAKLEYAFQNKCHLYIRKIPEERILFKFKVELHTCIS
jgi:hypothetical protein